MNTVSLSPAFASLPLLFFLSVPACCAAPVTVDPQALALLQKVQTATHKTHSLSAEFTQIRYYHGPARYYHNRYHEFCDIGTVKLMKPNYAFEQQWELHQNKATGTWEKSSTSTIHASDGKTAWLVFPNRNCQKFKADANGYNVGATDFMPTVDFFDLTQSELAQVQYFQKKGLLLGVTCAGTRIWEGQTYHLVDWEVNSHFGLDAQTLKEAPGGVLITHCRLYIGSDNLVYRWINTNNIGWSVGRAMRNVHVNAPFTAASFHFTPPPGAQITAL